MHAFSLRYCGAVLILTLAALTAPRSVSAAPISIPTVRVGNPGNHSDPRIHRGYVAYDYRIGTTEVTNAQYAEFLNTNAASDPLRLYSTFMGTNARGGIIRSGDSGSYTYTTKTNMGDKPVNYVDWYDAIRFANWLNNGQGTGETETGAYTLGPLDAFGTPTGGVSIRRNVGATWFLTTASEWHKGAYYDPTLASGSGGYWDFPTRSNLAPTIATANSVGDISNPGANVANYDFGADWNSRDGNVTTVGSAGPLSESYYGTSDQGGNVAEWTEYPVNISGANYRGVSGAGWLYPAEYLHAAASSDFEFGITERDSLGFRVATIPEPSTLALAGIGAVGLLVCGVRRRFVA